MTGLREVSGGSWHLSRACDKVGWFFQKMAWFCAMAVLLALPSTAFSMGLFQAYQLARNYDAVYEAASHEREAAREKPAQAAAGLLPNFALSASRNKATGSASFGEVLPENRQAFNHGWNLRLSQPLVRWQNWEAYLQAGAQDEQAEAQFRLARQELILRVAQTYFDALAAQESLAVSQAQLRALTQQQELAQRQFEAGNATITDIHESQSRLDLARAQGFSAENELESRLAELEKLTGVPAVLLNSLRSDVALPCPQPDQLQAWVEAARQGSLAAHIQQAALKAAEHALSRNRAAHLPTLDLVASREHNVATGSVVSPVDQPSDVRSSQISIQLNLPILSGGETSSRVREAQANRGKAIADLEAARRQAATAARQAFSGVSKGLARGEALALAVKSSQDAVEANKVDYRIGTRINIDVLNAEHQFYAARRDLAVAHFDVLIQGLKLKFATGSLDESDLLSINHLLQTEETP